MGETPRVPKESANDACKLRGHVPTWMQLVQSFPLISNQDK